MKEGFMKPKGEPTFIVRVKRRQNSTWQGDLQWIDGKEEKKFRSMLELIQLMEEVVSGADIPSD